MASEDQFGISNRFGSQRKIQLACEFFQEKWTLSALNASFRLTPPAGR
jgi:hypothetical protein